MAETTIKDTLNSSVFSLKEKQDFYKKKWLKDHISLLVLCVIAWVALIVFISVKGMQIFLVSTIGGFLALMIYTILYNRMMAYVESRIYDWK